MLEIFQMDKKLNFFFFPSKEEKKDFISQKSVCNLKKKDSLIAHILEINKQQWAKIQRQYLNEHWQKLNLIKLEIIWKTNYLIQFFATMY